MPAKKSSKVQEDEKKKTGATPAKEQSKSEKTKSKKVIDLSKWSDIIDLVYQCKNLEDIKDHLKKHLKNLYSASGLEGFTIQFLYQPFDFLDERDADILYNSIPKDPSQNILLIINSPGGRIEPAYLISKLCIEYSKKFIVAIPRKAKSAATLIALGAQEIHMGTMSELGPIDPQFGGLPALGLSSALERLAKLSKEYPESGEMFSNYLAKKLELGILGYFERVSESSVQYAQRLLKGKKLPQNETPETIAKKFVYSYKDHSFVIDKDEAKLSLGEHIKTDTKEYQFGNAVHNFLDRLNICSRAFKRKNISVIGDFDGFRFLELKENN